MQENNKICNKENSFTPIRPDNEQEFSKYLSYLLRHNPQAVGLELMENGWVEVTRLIESINNSTDNKFIVTLLDLIKIVDTDKKSRYSFKEDGDNKYKYIRANQGHSIKELVMNFKLVESNELPKYLYHGTSERAYEQIKKSGRLIPMTRQFVHLSGDVETATKVGKRHSKKEKSIILKIDTVLASADGIEFYISDNSVYLVKNLDTKYIIEQTINQAL